MSLFLHQIWRNAELHHLLTNGSSAVNGCRQNESPKKSSHLNQVYYLWIIVMFLSAVWTLIWRHPFTAEDPLVSKWCNATFLQIWWRNKLIYILNGLRVNTFSANFHFWVNLRLHSATCFQFLVFAQSFRETPYCHIRIVNIGIVYLYQFLNGVAHFYELFTCSIFLNN